MLRYLLAFLTVASFIARAQEIAIYPSYYLTYGKYSVDKYSLSNAVYATAGINYQWYPTVAYDNLMIKSNDWKYRQQTILGGFTYNSYPNSFKAYYAYLPATFSYLPRLAAGTPSFDYSNFSNLLAFEANRYIDEWNLGAAFVHMHAIGPVANVKETQSSLQLTLRAEYQFMDELTVTLRPSFFSSQRDGRELFSTAIKAQYQFAPGVILKAGGMAGVRAYYFDTDLLTVFNQDESQTQSLNIQCDYTISGSISAAALYVHSEFNGFQINYFGFGLKGKI
ncbi:MAG: hypothetical protein HYV28_03250 [Ignavibacteriales bacterium]|nr:hypothetical protein [Ignavibacteriales bacterium]